MANLSSKAGFTLIEIVVAMFLAGILSAGTIVLWDIVGQFYFQTSLKQKAVFALNSQTERLTSLYRWCDLYTHTTHTGNLYLKTGYVTTCANSFLKTSASDFSHWEDVYYNAAESYNTVYIDKSKNVVGKLYWKEQTVYGGGMCSTGSSSGDSEFGGSTASSSDCSALAASEAVCLTINLEYPYRWDNVTPAMTEDSALGPVRTIKVKTIVATKK
jgi:prepilin-type N-terminal cleavage/methylation domain-containing protein